MKIRGLDGIRLAAYQLSKGIHRVSPIIRFHESQTEILPGGKHSRVASDGFVEILDCRIQIVAVRVQQTRYIEDTRIGGPRVLQDI